jgi:hypothetical protein
VHKTEIILDDIPPIYANTTFTVSGILVDTVTREGINGKKIGFEVSSDTPPIPPVMTENVTIVQAGGIIIHSCGSCSPDERPDRGALDWDVNATQIQSEKDALKVSQNKPGNQVLYLKPGGIIKFPPNTLEVILHIQDVGTSKVVVEVTKYNPGPSSRPTFNATSYGSKTYISDFHIASNETIKEIKILSVGSSSILGVAPAVMSVGIASLETHNFLSNPSLRHYLDFEDIKSDTYGSPLVLDSGKFFSIGKGQFVPEEKPKPKVQAAFLGDTNFAPSSSGWLEYRTLEPARRPGTGGDPVDPVSLLSGSNPNDWPFADAGSDQTVGDNTGVYLDGTLSYDLRDTPEELTYLWSPVDLGRFEGEIEIVDPNSSIASFTAPDLDLGTNVTLQFKLTVADKEGHQDDDIVDITVESVSDALGAAGEPGSVVASNEADYTTITCGAGNDSDNDGLCNSWETSPYAITYGTGTYYLCGALNPHFAEYYSPGTPGGAGTSNACPSSQKDVFIEIDYMQYHDPDVTAIENVISAFENLPTGNGGPINMHISRSDLVASTEVTDLHVWKDTDGTNGNDFLTIKRAKFGTGLTADQRNAYANAAHYALFGHTIGSCGPSGLAEINGNDLIVTLGCGFTNVGGHVVGSTDEQAGTFMHELGHNFNLRHGGNVDMNCKANYQSVMKYDQQLPDAMGANWQLDYSRHLLGSLAEDSLIEASGVTGEGADQPYLVWGTPGLSPSIRTISASASNIDWDQDTLSDSGTNVSPRDLNNLGISGCGTSSGQTEYGYDDWGHLQMDPTTGATFDGVYPIVTEVSELTGETLKQIRQHSRSIWATSVSNNTPVPLVDSVEVTGSTSNAFPIQDYKVWLFWGDGEKDETLLSTTGDWGPLSHEYDQSAALMKTVISVQLLNATSDEVLAKTNVTTVQFQREPRLADILAPLGNLTRALENHENDTAYLINSTAAISEKMDRLIAKTDELTNETKRVANTFEKMDRLIAKTDELTNETKRVADGIERLANQPAQQMQTLVLLQSIILALAAIIVAAVLYIVYKVFKLKSGDQTGVQRGRTNP